MRWQGYSDEKPKKPKRKIFTEKETKRIERMNIEDELDAFFEKKGTKITPKITKGINA